MFGSKSVHFTEYSNIFPKMVVTGLTANISKLNFFPSVFYINYLSLAEDGILDDTVLFHLVLVFYMYRCIRKVFFMILNSFIVGISL
jgi:hypothetical protein